MWKMLTRCHVALVYLVVSSSLLAADPTVLAPVGALSDLYGDALPKDAIARLGTVRFRGQDSVKHVSFLADGKTMVVCSGKGRLKYYDVATGKLLRTAAVGKGSFQHVVTTPDRALMAMTSMLFNETDAAHEYYLHIVDMVNGKVKKTVQSSKGFGESLAISPDGATVVVSGRGGEFRFFDVASGAEVLNYTIDRRSSIRAAAFSPDSSVLALGGRNVLYLWNWLAGEEPRKISLGDGKRHRRIVMSLQFSADASKLALGLDGKEAILLFDTIQRSVIRVHLDTENKSSYVLGLQFSPDDQSLAFTHYRRGITIWDWKKGKLKTRLVSPYTGYRQLAYSPDGSKIAATNDWSNILDVFDVATQKRLTAGRTAHEAAPSFLQFLDDDKSIVTASDDGSLRLWDSHTGQQKLELRHPPDAKKQNDTRWIRAAAVSPDGKLVATSSFDDTVRLWNLKTKKELYRLPGHGRMGGHRALAFTPDGRRFASWGDDMRVYVWDVATGKAVAEYRLAPSGVDIPDEDEEPIVDHFNSYRFRLGKSMFSPDAKRLIVNLGSLYVFNTLTGRQLGKFDTEPGHIVGVAVSPDGRHALLSQWGKSVETKLADGRVRSSSAKNHPITLLRLEETGSDEEGSVIWKIMLPAGGAGPVAFSPDGRYVAVGLRGDSPSLRIYRTKGGREVGRIESLESAPKALAFSSDNNLLASSMRSANVLVWNVAAMTANDEEADK